MKLLWRDLIEPKRRYLMKNYKMVCVACVLAATFMITGYADAQSSPGKPMQLTVADMSPTTGTRAVFFQKAIKEIEQQTDGRIKTDVAWSETLVKVKEAPKAIQRGICDIAWVSPAFHPAEYPLWTHFMTILYHPKGEDAGYINRKAWELCDASKALRGDFEKMGQTAWFMCPYDSYTLYTKKLVKNLEDMKGMRIRVTGEGFAKMVKAMGGFGVFIPTPDVYSAFERGTVDGVLSNYETGKRYGFFEIATYSVEVNVFIQYAFSNVALATLAKMSEKDRKTFMDVGRRVSIEYGDAMKKEREEYKDFMKGKGLKILPFPEKEREKWAETPGVKGLMKDWIEEQNKAGRPGTEVMKTFLKVFEIPQWMPAGY